MFGPTVSPDNSDRQFISACALFLETALVIRLIDLQTLNRLMQLALYYKFYIMHFLWHSRMFWYVFSPGG